MGGKTQALAGFSCILELLNGPVGPSGGVIAYAVGRKTIKHLVVSWMHSYQLPLKMCR